MSTQDAPLSLYIPQRKEKRQAVMFSKGVFSSVL
jgi:hypothetical protein